MSTTRRKRGNFDWRRLLRAWGAQHAQALIFSIGQYVRNPLGSLLTTAVIGIALALPTAFYLLLVNAQRVTQGWDAAVQITLFLKLDQADADARVLANTLKGWPEIEGARVITREAALAEYQHHSGFADALSALEENPLPALVLLQPRADAVNGAGAEALLGKLGALPQVDSAQFDRQWVQRLFAIMDILRRGAIVLAALLAVAVMLIIGNTIRLAIYNRRHEIEVNTLFGATRAFIQRPFLYSGILHGIGGAILAWFLVDGALLLLGGPVGRLAGLYASQFQLGALSLREIVSLIAAGAALGLAGSWIALQRHLREVEAH